MSGVYQRPDRPATLVRLLPRFFAGRGNQLGEAGEGARPSFFVTLRRRRIAESRLGEDDLRPALPVLELEGHHGLDRALLLPLMREDHLLARNDRPVHAVGGMQ